MKVPASIESSSFVSHSKNVRGMWFKGRFAFNKIVMKASNMFKSLSFRELCDSKLSGLHPFYYMTIIHWVKNRLKTERWAVSSWGTNPWSNSCDPHWELVCCNKWHSVTLKISTPPEIAVGTHFHVRLSCYFYLVIEKCLGCYFQILSPYYQAVQCNKKTSIPVSWR